MGFSPRTVLVGHVLHQERLWACFFEHAQELRNHVPLVAPAFVQPTQGKWLAGRAAEHKRTPPVVFSEIELRRARAKLQKKRT